jgi:hypothetical protein
MARLRMHRSISAIITLVLSLVITACDSKTQSGVEGMVNFKGSPLDQGTIQFFPEAGGAPAGSALITNGKYTIPNSPGVPPGKYRIVISSGDAKAPPAGEMPGQSGPPAKERIPAEYNAESSKKPVIREVNKGPNQINFDIS